MRGRQTRTNLEIPPDLTRPTQHLLPESTVPTRSRERAVTAPRSS